ncbi:uncharacterized protein EAF01_010824 [Botrytis porri]|uniref:uncharacterized protein n=1 Tax=Botrytis porri TaxID=87229 RepID=UPI0019026AB7|nr:uncharacterized protein EAF01_010824 [Botrytis porri]KAF7889331.1 hypothetical protein EAF01_010824 [Botrytis porri]
MNGSYFRLMQEFDLKSGVYQETGSVIQFGAKIRREDLGPSLNGSSSGEMGTGFLDRESSEVTSSSEPSQALAIIARPNSQAVLYSSNYQYGTMSSAFHPSYTHGSIFILPVGRSIIEQYSNGHRNLHSAVTSSSQPKSSMVVRQASQSVPTNSSPPTKITIVPPHSPTQLPHPPPLNLKKAFILLSIPLSLSQFPHYLLKSLLLIRTQPLGELCLYSLILPACYYTGTLKFGFLAMKGLDGWLATLGNWSARGNLTVVRALGGLMKGYMNGWGD